MGAQELDNNLLLRIKASNDEQACRELFDHLYLSLLKFASQILESPEQGETIMDVFLKFWQRRTTLSPIEDIKNYFLGQ